MPDALPALFRPDPAHADADAYSHPNSDQCAGAQYSLLDRANAMCATRAGATVAYPRAIADAGSRYESRGNAEPGPGRHVE